MLVHQQCISSSLFGVLFILALCLIFTCVFDVSSSSGNPFFTLVFSLEVFLDWTHILICGVLSFVAVSAYLFGLFSTQHAYSLSPLYLVLGLCLPGLSSISSIVYSLSSVEEYITDGAFMITMSFELLFSALVFFSTTQSHSHHKHNCPSGLWGSYFFLLLATTLTTITTRPAVLFLSHQYGFLQEWTMEDMFPQLRQTSLVVGFAFQVFLSIQQHSCHLLPYFSSLGYIIASFASFVALVVPSGPLRTVFLTVGVALTFVGLIWDMVSNHRRYMDSLTSSRGESVKWQEIAERLQEINILNESSISTKTSFLAGLANEMKTIIHSTTVLISLLNDTDVQPNQSGYIAKLEKAIDRLTNLVREAQFYSEMESQKPTQESVYFRLDQLLEEVIASTAMRTHLDERDVDVGYLIESSVPIHVMGDYGRLKNILHRLLTNAVKATVQGEIFITVRCEEKPPITESKRCVNNQQFHHSGSTELQEEETVILSFSVVDTGIGIPPEDLSRIFDPFGLANRKREEEDLGLGLSICKQLARLFGGTLCVSSELARGTTFTLSCPFRTQQNPPTGLLSLAGLTQLERRWGVDKSVCVIDDNANVGRVISMHLLPVGCEVVCYENPTTALSELKNRPFDVVLIDYRLTGSNGEEIARQIRNDPNLRNLPIVVMCTAKQRKLITLLNIHFLYKPLKKEPLLTVVHMLCTSKQIEGAENNNNGLHKPLLPLQNLNIAPAASEAVSPPPSPEPWARTIRRSADGNTDSTLPPTPSHSNNSSRRGSLSSTGGSASLTSSVGSASGVSTNGADRRSSLESVEETEADTLKSAPDSANASLSNSAESDTPVENRPIPTRKDTILLVEDNPINAKIASAVLRKHQFEVELAGNGQIAMERIKVHHDEYQLILMDIHMPVMDGLTCAKLVRQFEREHAKRTIPIIALTADTSTGHKSACLEAGCNEFMSKPLDYPLLIDILKKLNSG